MNDQYDADRITYVPRTPGAALAELRAGNHRFVTGSRLHPNQDADYRAGLADGQHPFAVIVGCSDSRLAAELIFDRGLGDLFVIRTAGHTVGAEVLGSVEYAVQVLGTPLVVVLGHNACGAIAAARDVFEGGDRPSGNLGLVVEAIIPSVRLAVSQRVQELDGIEDFHIERTIDELLTRSTTLSNAAASGSCAIVGMAYHLSVGEVRQVGGTKRKSRDQPGDEEQEKEIG